MKRPGNIKIKSEIRNFENKNVTVIIPAYNEEKTIESVIKVAKKSKRVLEVIVVDNACTDNTRLVSEKAGASVVCCHKKGKGYAMEKGLSKAKGNIIVFLDADIVKYCANVVDIIAGPIYTGKADFVKTTFNREGGRVTELVAKPLLNILFPDLYKFSQPLSGAIGGKKKYLKQITLEKDYGVDIGILLDMANMGVRIEEVSIGSLKNNSQDWKALNKMSEEVSRAIIKRAHVIVNSEECKDIAVTV